MTPDPLTKVVALALKARPDDRIDLEGVTPDRLARLSMREIAALPVWVGTRQRTLGDVFDVHGEHADRVHLSGDLRAVDGIGAGMTAGEIVVEGDAGSRVGAGMTGGVVRVNGSVEHDAGQAMSGGLLFVAGDAGVRLGSAMPGASKGMAGGEIVVGGSAGAEAASRLRRGLVVVMGDVGEDAGRAMIAGSLIVFGRTGANPGRGSKRGSIVACGEISVPETYRYACTFEPPHVRLTLMHLRRRYGVAIDDHFVTGQYQRYCGDAGGPGKGEILVHVNAGHGIGSG